MNEAAGTTTTPQKDSTIEYMSLFANGISNAKGKFFSGLNYAKDKLYHQGTSETNVSTFVMFIIFFLFIGISYYLYDNYVKKMLDTKYVENKEFTDRNTKKQIDIYFFYTNWCPHCKKSTPEWNTFKEKIGDRKINNYSVKFFEVDCDKDSKVADKYKVEEYPTIKAISRDGVFDYDANVDSKTLTDFIESITS